MILGLFGVLLGTFPTVTQPLLLAAARAIGGDTVSLSLALWHGLTPTLALSAVTIAGASALYAGRSRLRQLAQPNLPGTERAYSSVLAAADAISRSLGRAFQGGSLASYTLVFMISAGVLVGVALMLSHSPRVRTGLLDWRLYEGLIVTLVIGGAVMAVRARRTMVAVLALGTSGYGVALIFLLYGAPDLAMTQFAVETLTAVIFVFVFWQFPRVDYRSPAGIKARDALVASAFGLVVAALTLQTGTMETNPRLSAYFAEMAPLAAHGRNIVNVILVDFRALDTLGETTVLVTAAVGVRALLLIAREQRKAQ
jgi:multicomponent Na+:H+ antiporter subunit A